jgi:ATP-dependent protease ClpP protease subunit
MIQIYALIGQPGEANDYAAYSQDRFQAELASAVSAGESVVQVRINSVGGNWLMAQGIFGMMKASALKIDTYNDGIAASSASLIFMGGRKRLMSAHARLMIHNCSGGAAGQVADLEKAIEGQKAINESMAAVYANATGQPLDKIREMMAAETWLSADEAVALGFATGIIDAPKTASAPPADLTSSTAEASLLQLQAYYAGHLPPASPSPNMKNLLLPILTAHAVAGITASATDEQVTQAVTAAFNENAQLRTAAAGHASALAAVTAQVTTATAEAQEAKDALKKVTDATEAAEKLAAENAVTQLVAKAVAAGKITADLAPTYTTLATANLAAATAALDKLPGKKGIIETIEASAAGTGATGRLTAASAMAEIAARTAAGK